MFFKRLRNQLATIRLDASSGGQSSDNGVTHDLRMSAYTSQDLDSSNHRSSTQQSLLKRQSTATAPWFLADLYLPKMSLKITRLNFCATCRKQFIAPVRCIDTSAATHFRDVIMGGNRLSISITRTKGTGRWAGRQHWCFLWRPDITQTSISTILYDKHHYIVVKIQCLQQTWMSDLYWHRGVCMNAISARSFARWIQKCLQGKVLRLAIQQSTRLRPTKS